MSSMTSRRTPSLTLPLKGEGIRSVQVIKSESLLPSRGRVREGDVWQRSLVSHG